MHAQRIPALLGASAIALILVLGIVLPGPLPTVATGNSITSPDTAGVVGSWPSLVLDAAGYPVVGYYDETNQDLKVLHCNDAACAGANESITSPGSAGDSGSWGISLVLDAAGYPVVSYYDWTNGDLKVLHCNDPDCGGGDNSITTVDSEGETGWYTSL